ncbi:MAG: hypothetical protein HOV80_14670 [Polyangiaceae bacterium]|nr:hypothetical protein [Polyangiaceae bacterium]
MRVPSVIAGVALLGSLLMSREARADETSPGMQSPAAFGIGIFLSGVGAAGVATGGWLFASAGDPCGEIDRDSVPSDREISACQTGVNQKVGGVIAMVTGGAFLLGGIPLIAVGATPEDEKSSNTARVRLELAPTSGSLRVDF